MSVAPFFVYFCYKYLLLKESNIFQNEIQYMKSAGTSHTTIKKR